MIRSVEMEGKTRGEAVRAACQALGVSEDDVSVEMLVMPKSGFLGIGARLAKVRVSYDDGRPEPKPRTETDSRPRQEKAPARKSETPKAAAVPVNAPAPAAPKAEEAPKAPAGTAITEFAPGSQAERTRTFLTGLLEHMGVECTVTLYPRESGGLDVKLDGPNMGAVIGRRGETLDAIQHLVNYAVNRGSDKHAHINVDAEDYRSKREESLVHLANKMAAKVLKYKRSMALEPMNSYERHVIHAALQDMEGVSTSSTGTEPNRRVVVNYERAPGEAEEPRPRRARPAPRGDRQAHRERPAPKAENTPAAEEPKAAPAPAKETLPPDFPEGYEPPTKNKPQSREWC